MRLPTEKLVQWLSSALLGLLIWVATQCKGQIDDQSRRISALEKQTAQLIIVVQERTGQIYGSRNDGAAQERSRASPEIVAFCDSNYLINHID